nr:DUF3298 and DUF4163 domain-containing protein [Christiangramia lutea]
MTACLSILLLISCADEKKGNNSFKEKNLNFFSRTVEKNLDDCLPEEGNCTFISLKFPFADESKPEAEKINKKIENFIGKTVDFQEDSITKKPEALAENFIKEYKETASEFPEYELPWEATINGKINYQSSEIISIKFDTYMFTGGAHGYRSTNFLNFDAQTGEILTPEDIFIAEFTDYVEKEFRKKQEIPMGASINSTGMFFENDEFHLPENIGISKDSVVMHYNAYDIAPYSEGIFVLTYSKEDVKQFLKIKK